MRIAFLNLAASIGLVACLSACGSGGRMDDGKNNSNLTGDLPGTGSMAQTAFEDADQPYNTNDMSTTGRVPAGQVVEVDSTEARGNSRWNDKQTETTSANSRLDKTAGLRARYSLIGSNPKNRSRIGQNMGANNPESSKETIYVPQ